MRRNIVKGGSWLALIVMTTIPVPSVASAGRGEGGQVAEQRTPPNIVLLLTDDQPEGTLRFMPNVQRLLVHQGVRFENSYVVNPVCCPSRVSNLTGGYSKTTGVYTNKANNPYGGFAAFDDDRTIATELQAAGYRTGFIGKYLNGYRNTTYVPPGWDRWFATHGAHGDSSYYDYTAISDGVEVHYGSDPSDYGQTILRREAISFIRGTDASQPLFMYWATPAPHAPAIPQPRDRDAYASLERWRPPSYDEADVADKPAHVRARPRVDGSTAREIDEFRLDQIRSLQAADRAAAAIVETLQDTGRLQNTIIVFTSDNGMLWGEHRLFGKSEIYEESISVPLVVRYDALLDEPRRDDNLALNIDLAPTFAELAGISLPDADGRSLLPLLDSPNAGWRDSFLIEHLRAGAARMAPTFCAVHTDRFVLVRYATGEQELYDLVRDPNQMQNRDGWAAYRNRQRALRANLRTLCDPMPPGFAF